jgi:hypothetical protein
MNQPTASRFAALALALAATTALLGGIDALATQPVGHAAQLAAVAPAAPQG